MAQTSTDTTTPLNPFGLVQTWSRILLPVGMFMVLLWAVLDLAVTYLYIIPDNDFGKFYFSTLAFWQHENMYGWNAVTTHTLSGQYSLTGEDLPIDFLNMNPPHFHFLLLPLISLSPANAYLVWMAVGLLFLGISCQLTLRKLQANKIPWSQQLAWITLFGCSATPIIFRLGQVTWLLLVPVTLMWLSARQKKWIACGLFLGLLCALKLFFLLFFPYFLLKRNITVLSVATLTILAVFGLGLAIFGLENYSHWIASLGQSDTWAWMEVNASLWGFMRRSFATNPLLLSLSDITVEPLKLVWLFLAGSLVVLSVGVAGFDNSEQKVDRAFVLLLVSAILYCPLGWNYYIPMPLRPLTALMVAWRKNNIEDDQPLPWNNWRWRMLLLAGLGFFCPAWITNWFQPNAVATLTLASIYFWATFLVWLVLLLDGWPHVCLPFQRQKAE